MGDKAFFRTQSSAFKAAKAKATPAKNAIDSGREGRPAAKALLNPYAAIVPGTTELAIN